MKSVRLWFIFPHVTLPLCAVGPLTQPPAPAAWPAEHGGGAPRGLSATLRRRPPPQPHLLTENPIGCIPKLLLFRSVPRSLHSGGDEPQQLGEEEEEASSVGVRRLSCYRATCKQLNGRMSGDVVGKPQKHFLFRVHWGSLGLRLLLSLTKHWESGDKDDQGKRLQMEWKH